MPLLSPYWRKTGLIGSVLWPEDKLGKRELEKTRDSYIDGSLYIDIDRIC